MTIEKRGVMYLSTVGLMVLFAAASIFGCFYFFSENVIPDQETMFIFYNNVTYGVIFIVACVSFLASIVFFILKKLRVFSILIAIYFASIACAFAHGFVRMHIYLFDKYDMSGQLFVSFAFLALVLSIVISLVLGGVFPKLASKILSLLTLILSLAMIAYSIIWLLTNAKIPDSLDGLIDNYFRVEYVVTYFSIALFAIPLLFISLWIFVTCIKNGFTNYNDDSAKPIEETPKITTNNEEKRFCPNCGVPLNPGVAFCPNCGNPCEVPVAPVLNNESYEQKKAKQKKLILTLAPVLGIFIVVIVASYFAFQPPKPKQINVSEDSITLDTFSSDNSIQSVDVSYYNEVDGPSENEYNVWYGQFSYDTSDSDVADIDAFTNKGVDIVAQGEGNCVITVSSKSGLKETISVEVENTLESLFDEAGCDEDWAELSSDGKSITIDMLDYPTGTVKAVSYLKDALGFTQSDFFSDIQPYSWSASDSGSLESDVATCEWEFNHYYFIDSTYYVTFRLN